MLVGMCACFQHTTDCDLSLEHVLQISCLMQQVLLAQHTEFDWKPQNWPWSHMVSLFDLKWYRNVLMSYMNKVKYLLCYALWSNVFGAGIVQWIWMNVLQTGQVGNEVWFLVGAQTFVFSTAPRLKLDSFQPRLMGTVVLSFDSKVSMV
jgi:hypothetical protein